jgi:hypothetical protein
LQSIKISPDVNEIDENIDAINQQKSQMFYQNKQGVQAATATSRVV